jgi:hypothetical protein
MISLKVKIDRVRAIKANDDQLSSGIFGNSRCEPYLWTLFIKIDGTNIHQNKDFPEVLNGVLKPEDVFIGTFQSLGKDVPSDAQLAVPNNVGEWNTATDAININLFGKNYSTHGIVLVVYVLLEEDSTPISAIKAGYQALTSTVIHEINQAIGHIDLTNFIKNGDFDYKKFLDVKLGNIEAKAKESAINAIKDKMNFFQKIGTAGRNDDFIGSEVIVRPIQSLFGKQENFNKIFDGQGKWEVSSHIKCGYVKAFEHIHFNGNVQELLPGFYNDTDLVIGNDVISSMVVPTGLKVMLFEHNDRGGHHFVLTNDILDFTQITAHELYVPSPIGGFNPVWDKVGISLNDMVSSLEISVI